jgi:hypothetical protein
MGFSSRRIYFLNIIKAGEKFTCRGAAFEPSPKTFQISFTASLKALVRGGMWKCSGRLS